MRRILSVIFVLTMVMGATGLFAAQADWKGYFITSFRNISTQADGADNTLTTRYAFQKLELYPTFKLSENVALTAGFYSQNYWGAGRLYGIGDTGLIKEDTGGFKTGFALPVSSEPSTTAMGTLNTTLGVSAAFATMKFQVGGGELGIDVGRRKNPHWGTGAFLGSAFTPDRIFMTYKTSSDMGMLIPFLVYEERNSQQFTGIDSELDTYRNMSQALIGLIVYSPGSRVWGLVINPNFVGEGYKLKNYYESTKSTVFWAIDLYVEEKVKMGGLNITPIFEAVLGFGNALNKSTKFDADLPLGGGATLYPADYDPNVDLKIDTKNFLLKVKVEMPKMITITPEFSLSLAPSKTTSSEIGFNAWNPNAFCGGLYTIGNIYGAGHSMMGYTSVVAAADPGAMAPEVELPSLYYGKLEVEFDMLGEMVKGLSATAAVIYAGVFGEKKMGGVAVADSDKSIITEIDLGVSYKMDSFTTISADFGYATWGENSVYSAAAKRTDMFLGADLEIKF